MSLQDKYRPVLDLGLKFGTKDGYVKEEDGKLKIGGTVATQYETNCGTRSKRSGVRSPLIWRLTSVSPTRTIITSIRLLRATP